MDSLKTILTIVAIILGALVVLATVGLIYSALSYLLMFAVLCLAGYIVVRVLTKKSSPQINAGDPHRELKKAERTLEEYRRKLK